MTREKRKDMPRTSMNAGTAIKNLRWSWASPSTTRPMFPVRSAKARRSSRASPSLQPRPAGKAENRPIFPLRGRSPVRIRYSVRTGAPPVRLFYSWRSRKKSTGPLLAFRGTASLSSHRKSASELVVGVREGMHYLVIVGWKKVNKYLDSIV